MEAERNSQDTESRHQNGLSLFALPRPLEIAADLVVEQDGLEALKLHADGRVVCADVPGLSAAMTLARQSGLLEATRRQTVAKLAELLVSADLLVEIRVRTHLVARVGADARAGHLSRLISLPGVELRLLGILKALISR